MPTNMNKLTSKQKLVYAAIESYIKQKGISPTVREIGEMLGEKTPGAVQGILKRLEAKGFIKKKAGSARSIILLSEEGNLYETCEYIPEIKKITARNCNDLLNFYNIRAYKPVPKGLIKNPESTFIIQCSDISLEESGFRRGDVLFVCQSAEIHSGDIILVFYNNQALLRYYYPGTDDGTVILKADIDLFGKEEFKPDEIKIIGKIVGKYTAY